jgi:hypothetical protein
VAALTDLDLTYLWRSTGTGWYCQSVLNHRQTDPLPFRYSPASITMSANSFMGWLTVILFPDAEQIGSPLHSFAFRSCIDSKETGRT